MVVVPPLVEALGARCQVAWEGWLVVSDSWVGAPSEERVGGSLEGASGSEERKRY